MTLSQHTLYVS